MIDFVEAFRAWELLKRDETSYRRVRNPAPLQDIPLEGSQAGRPASLARFGAGLDELACRRMFFILVQSAVPAAELPSDHPIPPEVCGASEATIERQACPLSRRQD